MKSSEISSRGRFAMTRWKSVKFAALITLLAIGTSTTALSGNPNPNIAPINSSPYGKSYPQWAGEWWQWLLSIPSDESPNFDATGENADIGQDGPVWFLGGNFGGTSVREVFVPEGKSLFFPILNRSWIQTPSDPVLTAECIQNDYECLRVQIRPSTDNAILSCEIDGKAVKNLSSYREDSAAVTVTLPNGNLFGLPAGDYAPFLDNGYYLMVDPLKTGQHTIRFKGETADHGFSLDVTYRITVGKPTKIVAPNKRYRGKSYGEWAGKWWQWALGIPAAQNPVLDSTGEFADIGQKGSVWFLGGTFGDSVERTLTIPRGKALFIPVHNWIFGASVGDCKPTVPGVTCDVPTLRAAAAAATTSVQTMEVSIDGEIVPDIRNYRALSPDSFSVTLPEGNVLELFGFPSPAGIYDPQVADGYWLMLKPLSPGNHAIRMRVTNPNYGMDYTIILHLAVESGHKK